MLLQQSKTLFGVYSYADGQMLCIFVFIIMFIVMSRL